MGSSAQAGDSLESLMQALSSDDAAARAEAACRIGRLGFRAKGAVTALVELLSDASAVEDIDCDHRGWHNSAGRWETSPGRQAARALADIGNRSFDPLVLALDGSSWVARKNAAFALGRLENERAVAPLAALFGDAMPAVREQAAWALGRIDHPDALAPLVDALEKDSHDRVREQAAWALGRLEDESAVPPLAVALKDTSARVREQAAWALGKLDARSAVPALSKALSDDEARVREQVSWALGKIEDKGALPALSAHSKIDPANEVQSAQAKSKRRH